MADVKKWSLLLYDEGEKLLECRILKKDEVVSCGETLTFNAFLVDVNGAEGDHEEPPNSSNLRRSESRTAEKSKSRRSPLSPSHMIIKEWEVLYTTQLTQKAKKYHDGFVQLSIRGSIGRQLTLFDESRNSLDSRFLKKGEKIESGATIAFDGHLVEIGEPRGDHESNEKNNSNVKREKGVMHGQQSCGYRKNTLKKESIENEVRNDGVSQGNQDSAEPSATEWQVLYTTQLTQKSKKYHDGFLKLEICGSRGRQAMLYDETRKLLNTRFLENRRPRQS